MSTREDQPAEELAGARGPGDGPAPRGEDEAGGPEQAEAGPGDGGGDAVPVALADRVAELEEEAANYLRQAQRLKADFDNYRRRMMQEQQSWSEAAVGDLVRELLPIIDNLERAVEAFDAEQPAQSAASLQQGVAMTLQQFQDVLRRIGVEPVDAEGAPFDPQAHEAMAEAYSPAHAPGTVVSELQKGYRYKTRLLRPSLVKVARRRQDAEEGDHDE